MFEVIVTIAEYAYKPYLPKNFAAHSIVMKQITNVNVLNSSGRKCKIEIAILFFVFFSYIFRNLFTGFSQQVYIYYKKLSYIRKFLKLFCIFRGRHDEIRFNYENFRNLSVYEYSKCR